MATDLCDHALYPILLKKTTEHCVNSKACKSFRINDKAVKPVGKIFQFMSFSEK